MLFIQWFWRSFPLVKCQKIHLCVAFTPFGSDPLISRMPFALDPQLWLERYLKEDWSEILALFVCRIPVLVVAETWKGFFKGCVTDAVWVFLQLATGLWTLPPSSPAWNRAFGNLSLPRMKHGITESQEVSLAGTVDQGHTSHLFRPDGIPPCPPIWQFKKRA